MPSTYVLENLHFHWYSEHTIDDERYEYYKSKNLKNVIVFKNVLDNRSNTFCLLQCTIFEFYCFRFPLELHLVHYDYRKRSLDEALSQRSGVVVLAVLFYVSLVQLFNKSYI